MQTTIEVTSTRSDRLNHGDRKTVNTPSRSRTVDQRRPEGRVVAGVDLVHRRRVVAGRAEGEVGQLLEGHPDDGHQGQQDDLDDGEVDRREQAPEALPEPGQRIGRGGAEGAGRTAAGVAMGGTLDADGARASVGAVAAPRPARA